jgi:hypothetical protein
VPSFANAVSCPFQPILHLPIDSNRPGVVGELFFFGISLVRYILFKSGIRVPACVEQALAKQILDLSVGGSQLGLGPPLEIFQQPRVDPKQECVSFAHRCPRSFPDVEVNGRLTRKTQLRKTLSQPSGRRQFCGQGLLGNLPQFEVVPPVVR